MISQPEVVKIIKDIANKHNLPPKVVMGIIEVYFQVAAETIKSGNAATGDFLNILIPYFGRFYVAPKTKEHYKKICNHEKKTTEQIREEGDT